MLPPNTFIPGRLAETSPLPPRIVSDVLLPPSVQPTAADLATAERAAARNEAYKRLQQELKAGVAQDKKARQLSQEWAPKAPSPAPKKTKRVSSNSWTSSNSSPDTTLVEASHEHVTLAPPKTEVPLPILGPTIAGIKRAADASDDEPTIPLPIPSLPRHLAEEAELSVVESTASIVSNTDDEMPRKRRRRRSAAVSSTRSDSNNPTKAVSGLNSKRPQIYELSDEDRMVWVDGDLLPVILKVEEHSYRHFKDNKGQVKSGCGAIIPLGYQVQVSGTVQCPCPVRGCGRLFRNFHSLGAHFSQSYMGTAFNDNGDGTISRIGGYKPNVPIKAAHAVVVSRNLRLMDPDTKEAGSDASSAAPSVASTSQETDDDDTRETPDLETTPVTSIPHRDHSQENQSRRSRSRITRSQSAKELPSSPKIAHVGGEKRLEDKDDDDDDDAMDLEDWEIAPGKQVDKTTRETSAFSGPYMTQGKPLRFADDLGFYRIQLEPGRTHIWEPEEDTLRWFEVFSGKLDVTPKGAKSYRLGPGSHLVIRPGAGYTVQNRRQDTAVMSCYVKFDFALTDG